jgi:C-terminal processing protease CtpA/Prc
VLRMPTWALYNSKWAWKPWLEERLDSLAGAEGLIVDLRANEGGEDCGDLILSRLIERDFSPPGVVEKIRFRTTPKHLDPVLDTWDDSFRKLGVGAKALGDGFYLRPGADEISRIAASPKRLRVPVAVLIGQVNSSATFQFARNVRSIGKARLYGQPTGGNRRGINGGCYFFVRLPASGLEFDLPLVGYFPVQHQPDAGVLPAVLIVPTAADIAAGRDPVMERAVADLRRA